MYLIQILLVLFFLVAAVKTVNRFRSGDIGRGMAAAWLILWVGGSAAVLSPNSTFYLARWLGVQRGVDAVVYLAMALLFFAVFRLVAQVEHLERNVTLLTRALSLKSKDDLDKKV